MKDAFWLRHDSNAQHDERILELRAEFGWEGYGLFWALVERMRDAQDYRLNMNLGGLCAGLGVLKPLLLGLVQLGIDQGLFELEEDGAYFFSPSLRRRMEDWDAKRATLSEAGRLGAERKAAKKAATLKPPLSHPKATLAETTSHPEATLPVLQAEKRREEERREENKPLPSVEDAASAAAPAPVEVEDVSPLPESPQPELRTPGGAADVATSVEPPTFTVAKGGRPLESDVLTYFQQQRPHNPPAALAQLAAKWHAHYSANGWKVGKNPMKDWQAACRTWLADVPKLAAGQQQPTHSNPQRNAVYSNNSAATGAAARLHTPAPDATAGWGYPGS